MQLFCSGPKGTVKWNFGNTIELKMDGTGVLCNNNACPAVISHRYHVSIEYETLYKSLDEDSISMSRVLLPVQFNRMIWLYCPCEDDVCPYRPEGASS